jgi:hypothetical protein
MVRANQIERVKHGQYRVRDARFEAMTAKQKSDFGA